MLRARPGTAACVLGTHDRDDAATSRHGAFTYVPRSPAASPLFEIVRSHLLEFLADSRRSSDDAGVPAFVERELRDFLGCGSFARGFARFRCDGCQAEILVPFTCKGRGFCPSCCGRRMAERSMHLVDSVLGGLPIRQWVLTCPWRLRYAMAWDQRLCRAVLAVFVRAVLGLQRRRARRRGFRGGVGGAVTAIQRSGAALNLNVHFHGLVADGVFIPTPDRGGSVSCPCRRPRTRRWRRSSPRSAAASSDSHAGAASRSRLAISRRGRAGPAKPRTVSRRIRRCSPASPTAARHGQTSR